MFCYQCEQTDRSGEQAGCHSSRGNCGKDEGTAALQDLLVYVCCGIGQYARRARELGAADARFADFAAGALFTTLTNVNFNSTRFVMLLGEADQVRERARSHYEQAARERGLEPEQLSGPATLALAKDVDDLVAQGGLVGVDAGMDVLGPDVVGLRNLNLYGLKGVCAYTHHATVLGHRSEAVDAGIEAALDFLADPPTTLEPLLEHALGLGRLNLEVMELLDAANTGSFGHPTPTEVRVTPVAGKAILVSGHDLGDLRTILELTAGSGVNVYTHGELLPAHGYPELHSLANTANWEGSLELYIRLQPEGLFSTYLAEQAAVGDSLIVHGPQVAFGLRENGIRPRWFVGGGTGIAPLLSMLRRMAEWGDPQPARLYAGFNDEAEVFGAELFDELGAELGDFSAEICVWKPSNGWSGYAGTPVDAMSRDLRGEPEAPDVYVCGPPALIDAAADALIAGGVPATQVFSKRITAN